MAGGWLAGQEAAKQRAIENKQRQQALAGQAAQLALDQKREASEEALRNFDMDDRRTASLLHQGIDPKTNKPIMSELTPDLTQIRPGNKGRGGPATPQDQYDHAMKVGTFLNSRGFTDQARPYFDTAQTIATQIGRNDMFKNDFAKALVLANVTTSRQLQVENARGAVDRANIDHRASVDMGVHQANRLFDVANPTYGETHPRPLSTFQDWEISAKGPQQIMARANAASRSTDEWVSNTIRGMSAQNDAATKGGKEPPNPNMSGFAQGLQRFMGFAKAHPERLDYYIKQALALPLSDSQKAATVEALRRAAGNATLYHQAQQGMDRANRIPGIGGSVTTPPPALP